VAATVVLVHGAWHGAWCWEKVVGRLRDDGVPVLAVDRPGHGDSREALGDLAVDAAALRSTLDGLDEAVVCGHSYGGAVVGEAGAAHPAVRHLVFISAIVLAPGESCQASVTPVEPVEPSLLADGLRVGDDGTVTVDPAVAVPALYHDCSPADVERALPRLGPQRVDSLHAPARWAAWQRPSTYAVCRDDRALPPGLQQAFARRASEVVEWPTSHSPFLSRPDLVTALLAARARAVES
jgi:pimeloyl-ACP methyl ester carboxylesterase